jgi:uridylate kinase
LKVSGEALGGESGSGLCADSLARLTEQVSRASSLVQIAIVVGAGNICRGQDWQGTSLPQPMADAMGMAATHVNALALHSRLLIEGTDSVVMGAGSPVPQIRPFESMQGRSLLEQGTVLILSGGTGNPFFTTDTCASLRAAELGCSEVLKATKVNGVYDRDPVQFADAVRYETLSFDEALRLKLRVMDSTAFTMCNEQGLDLRVFDMTPAGAVEKALLGEPVGTLVSSDSPESSS